MSQIAFFLDSFRVYWYGIIIALAVLSSVIVALFLRRIQRKDCRAVLFIGSVGGIQSLFIARLVHWYCCPGQYADFKTALTNLKSGGFSILGVFIGCAIAILLARVFALDDCLSSMFDFTAVAGALGICIGRLGSAFTTSDRGKLIITKPFFQRLPFAVKMSDEAGGEWQFATFAFESIAALAAFIIVLRIFSSIYIAGKTSRARKGDAALIFIAFFGATQAVLESTRYDALFLRSNGFVSLMQVLSSIALVAVLVVFSIRTVRLHGRQFKYVVMWVISFLLIGVAMLFEYLVQRYGDLYVYFYAGMLSCMLCVYLITYTFYRYSITARPRYPDQRFVRQDQIRR